MPSSLAGVLPSTSVCSTSPPVSVCGTGAAALARGFSRRAASIRSAGFPASPLRLGVVRGDFPPQTTCALGRPSLAPGPSAPRPPIAHGGQRRHGNLNPLSIAYASRPRLRPGSPAADQPGRGTLGHSVGGVRAPLALLVPTFALPPAPPDAPALASRLDGTLPYHALASRQDIRGFGAGLEPRWIVGAAARSTSELLRTLSRVAASKPTSWLSARRDHLAHLARS